MDRSTALALLPETYRRLLTMLDAGRPMHEIGTAIGVDETALPALVAVGNAKLRAIMSSGPDDIVGSAPGQDPSS